MNDFFNENAWALGLLIACVLFIVAAAWATVIDVMFCAWKRHKAAAREVHVESTRD